MRIAVLPIVGFTNVQGESDYILYRQMVRDFVQMGKPVFSYLCLPRISFGKASNEPGLQNLYTEGPLDPSDHGGFRDMLATASPTFLDLFGPRNCRYPVDAVVTSRTDAAPSLVRWLWDWRAGREVVPMIVNDPQVCNMQINEANDTALQIRSLGYLMGRPVFNTENELDLAMKAASRFFLPSVVRQIRDRAKVIAVSLSFSDLDRVLAHTKRAERFTLFFAGRLNAAKQADVMLKLYDEIYRSGRDVDVVICSPKAEANLEVPRYVRLEREMKRSEFIAEAARAHVYLNTSKAEGFSAGFVEQVYLVPVSIVPNKPWVRSILDDKMIEHPFVYDTVDEARAMLRYCYSHFEEAKERCWPVRHWLRERYHNRLVADELLGVIEGAIRETRQSQKTSDSQADLFWRVLKVMPDEFQFEQFWEGLCEKAAAQTKVPQRGGCWRHHAYCWLTENAEDLVNGPEPVFRKRS